MAPLGMPPARPRCRRLVELALASLTLVGVAAAQTPVTIPPPRSWEMLDLPGRVPALAGRRGPGAPCDNGTTIAPDRIRVTDDGVACLPNPGHETRMWCDALDPLAERLDSRLFRGPHFTWPSWTNAVREHTRFGDNFGLAAPLGDQLIRQDSTLAVSGLPPLDSSREIIRALEAAEAWGSPADSAVRWRLAIVDTLLQQRMRDRGAEPGSAELAARTGRLRLTGAWVSDAAGAGDLAAALVAIAESVRTSPGDASARAWRAALFDTRIPRRVAGAWDARPLDRARALASLRGAREIIPAHAGFAWVEARWLAEADDFAGAREALRSCRMSDRTLVAILDDLCGLPRFRDLGFRTLDDYALGEWRERLAQALRDLGRDADFLEFRLRGWSWPDSADAAAVTLRRAWPGFDWFRVAGRPGGFPGALYAQRIASPRAGAGPATRPGDVRRDLDGGISLILVEHPATDDSPPCCTLVTVDWRGSH